MKVMNRQQKIFFTTGCENSVVQSFLSRPAPEWVFPECR
ncbi:hypothetical protein UYSO10_2989 [Kosakonia radicincitans]|nr:hypothetical protein UYSO10_2989 [Kosakonia radicincitans]